MASGKASARDARYGRRGGGWVDDGRETIVFDRACTICLLPMVCGQRKHHLTCCVAAGGITNHPACNPMIFTGNGPGCAHCGPKPTA